jgi:hypothetical protein
MSAWRRPGVGRPVPGGGRWRACLFATFALVVAGVLAARWLHPPGAIAPRWSPHEWVHNRRWSPPLVTRDAWRDYAEHVCDTVTCRPQLKPDAVHAGDVVWVGIDVALQYLRQVAPTIAAPHVVVSHDGDAPFTAAHAAALDASPGVVAWFAQNIDAGVAHPRLWSLPIGVENRRYDIGRFPALYSSLPRYANLRRWMQHGAVLLSCMASGVAGDPMGHGVSSSGVAHAPTKGKCVETGKLPLVYAAFNTATNPAVRVPAGQAVAGMPWVTSLVGGVESPPRDVGPHYDEGILADLATAAAAVGSPCLQAADEVAVAAEWWGPRTEKPLPQRGVAPVSPQQPGPIPQWAWDIARGMNPSLAATLRSNFELMTAHPFVLSPPGNGHQAHRTWEAVYAGSIPITLRYGNAMDAVLDGLPALAVDEFSATTLGRPALYAALARAACVWHRTLAAAPHAGTSGTSGGDHATAELPAGGGGGGGTQPLAESLDRPSAGSTGVWQLERAYAGWWLAAVDAQRWRAATP